MEAEERSQWITILEAASANSPDELNDDWEWLIDELGMPFEHFPALLEAIRQGRWRAAKNPKTYIKTVTTREARKLGLAEAFPPELELAAPRVGMYGAVTSQEQVLEELALASYDEDYERPEWQENFEYLGDYLISKLPDDLKMEKEIPAGVRTVCESINASMVEDHLHLPLSFVPNWKASGQRAGFDEWEQLALECRISRKSREKALAEQPDETSRKALQAAWKKFDRTGRERLQNALKINSAKNVPDSAFSDTR